MERILNPLTRPQDVPMPALPQDIMVAVFGVLIVLALIWALRLWLRQGDDRALILMGCGAAAATLEGFACHLIQCHHSEVGIYQVYEAFGIHVPLWLAEVYVLFFGAATYVFITQFARRPSARLFWWSFVLTGVGEGLFEMYGIGLGMWAYWGVQPTPILGFPLHLGFVNPTLAVVLAAVAAAWFQQVRGAARWALILLTPFLMTGLYAALIVPVATGLHAQDAALAQGGALLTMGMSLVVAWGAWRWLLAIRR